MPRLLAAVLLTAGIVITGVKYHMLAASSQSPYSQTTAVTGPTSAAAPKQPGPTTTPVVTPAPAQPAPKPVAVAHVTHSAVPAPVVTPSGNASVTGLTPVDPTPAPASPPADTGTAPTTDPSGDGSASGGTSTTTAPPLTTTSYLSTNWSGYLAATPHTDYTTVSGAWTVPTATSTSNQNSYDAAWIGIGGVTSGDLIQVGTMDTVSHGQETSSAFYELLPRSATAISSLTVTPGDSMNAVITETANGQWSITITDITTGKSFTTAVGYSSSLSSAEWIEEDPSSSFGNLLPFDSFTPVTFTGATTTAGGGSITAAAGSAQPITLVTKNSQQSLAAPSALGADGQSFTVTRTP
jgi:hypothetical protein